MLPPLPESLATYLAGHAREDPPSEESRRAFDSGLAFAFDVKEADDLGLDDDVVFCDDAWPLAAAELLRVFVHAKDSADGLSLVEELAGGPDADELITVAEDELMNWRFLRYTGSRVFKTLDEVFAGVLGGFFFAPAYVWLNGRFMDMREVPTVRVGGKVVYAALPSSDGGTVRSYASPGRDRAG